VDDHPDIYTEECLREMKQKHEKLIYEQCEMIGKPSSEILMFWLCYNTLVTPLRKMI
jgi:hypothetical protein